MPIIHWIHKFLLWTCQVSAVSTILTLNSPVTSDILLEEAISSSHSGITKDTSWRTWEQHLLPIPIFSAYFGASGKSAESVHSTESPGYSLLSLIDCTQAAEATIPRDRLFALLSFANDLVSEERQQFQPDYYEILDWKIFRRHVSILVEKDQYMVVLLRSATKPADPKVPSWICSLFTPVPTLTILVLPLGIVDSGFYNAGGSSRVNLRFGYLDELLIVSGGVVDTIERVAAPPAPAPHLINQGVISRHQKLARSSMK